MNRLRASLVVLALVATTPFLGAQQAASPTAPATTASLAAAPDQQFSAQGATIRYREVGTGDPIIFIHGYTSSIEGMIGLANALPPNYHKVALDVRGFGKSTKFADASRYGQAMVDDVIHLMDHLKIQKAHIVGHSMGALIGANLVSRYSSRISTAALVAGPFWDEKEMVAMSKRWTTDLEAGNGLQKFFLWLLPGMSEQMATATNAGILKANNLGALTESMRALPKLTITELKKNGDKTLLVAGTVDPLTPTSQSFAKLTKGAKLIEVQGANHVTVLTNPQTVKAITEQISQ